MPYLTESNAIIHAGVSGISLPTTYSWTSLEGGDVQAETVNTMPGGMQPAISLGGPAKRTDITVKRPHDPALQQNVLALENHAGKRAAWVSYTHLDPDGNKVGKTYTMNGTLKEVQRPNYDANGTGVAYLTLVITPDAQGTSS